MWGYTMRTDNHVPPEMLRRIVETLVPRPRPAATYEYLANQSAELRKAKLAALRKTPHATSARNAEIVRLAAGGMSKDEIACKFGISRSRVHQIITRA